LGFAGVGLLTGALNDSRLNRNANADYFTAPPSTKPIHKDWIKNYK
jgi:hypothetical protein